MSITSPVLNQATCLLAAAPPTPYPKTTTFRRSDPHMKLPELFDTSTALPAHERYGEKPFPGSSHDWALSALRSVPSIGNLLDIGPGSGIIAKQLAESGLPPFTAVEPDRSSWDYLTPLYPTLVASLEDIPVEPRFDTIMLLDVLEHVVEPGPFLGSAATLLRPGGHILISVPNVAHLAIRLLLLAGYFPKMSKGPLDQTHLHFFTAATITNLITAHPSLEIVQRRSSIPPLELLTPPRWHQHPTWRLIQRAHLALANLLPGLFAYQLLYIVRKK